MAKSSEPVVLDLASVPREQMGPFLMLGLDKTETGQKILAKLGYKGYESGDPQQLAALTKWLGY